MPTRASRTGIGTFPFRKPGIFKLPARSEAAWSIACSTSPLGTSTVMRTRLSGSSSTVAFTERPLCQQSPGPPKARGVTSLEDPDEEQDDDDQREDAAADVHRLASFRSMDAGRDRMYPDSAPLTPSRCLHRRAGAPLAREASPRRAGQCNRARTSDAGAASRRRAASASGEGRLRRPGAGRGQRADAGERTRTSKGLATQRDLNPPRLPVPPRPRESRIERERWPARHSIQRDAVPGDRPSPESGASSSSERRGRPVGLDT